MERLPASREKRVRLAGLFGELSVRVPSLYATLPQQVIHGDYTPGNVFMADDRVAAVNSAELVERVRAAGPRLHG